MSRFLKSLNLKAYWHKDTLIGGLALGGTFLLAALIMGAHPQDSSINAISTLETQHWAGVWGAAISDIILQLIGGGIWVLLLPIAVWGIRRIRGANFSRENSNMRRQILAIPAALIFASFGLALSTHYGGGILGHILYEGARTISQDIITPTMLQLTAPVFIGIALCLALYASHILIQVLGFAKNSTLFFAAQGLALFYFLKRRIKKSAPDGEKDSAKDKPQNVEIIKDGKKEKPTKKPVSTPTPVPDMGLDIVAPTPPPTSSSAPSAPPTQKSKPKKQVQASHTFESGQVFELPPLTLLSEDKNEKTTTVPKEILEENARQLEAVLSDFGIRGRIATVRPGPVVTLYELELAAGIRTARVVGLADDIARSMSAVSCRVSPVPGANLIGIELPNENRESVALRTLLSSDDFMGKDNNGALVLALGKDISGAPVLTDLSKMPHLLVAGTTGSGKSVGINSMILSLLYRLTPDECRLILVDPKMLEFSSYDGIPHLLTPVVTEPKKAVVALKWVVMEMENRYRKMAKINVRNIDGFNTRMREALTTGEVLMRRVQTGHDPETGTPIFEEEEIAAEVLPYIVVVIDEMADLMMVAGKEIEQAVQRLAQMARAAGVHLITATQRPSVDVITGTIKANFPSRISFQVTSKIDSRTVLGEQGAEQLLGQGDMLFMEGGGKTRRVHGAFVSDEEVEQVVGFLKKQAAPAYIDQVVQEPEEGGDLGVGDEGGDSLYEQAVALVVRDGRASTSYVQRKLQIGYNRAARLMEEMEERGVISPPNHAGKREILVDHI